MVALKERTFVDSELELLGLPDVPHVVFKQPPLALALCQVRYNSILSVTNPSFVATFQKAIQDQYPIVTSAPLQEIGVQVENVTGEVNIQQGSPSLRWQFADTEDNWRVVLTPDYLAIETRTYKHFNDFLDRLRKALDALIQYIQPTSGIRLGLRYVNEFRPGHMDWSKVIRKELLGPVAVPSLVGKSSQITALQQMQLRFPDARGININHGLLPSGTSVRPRTGQEFVDQPFYLLDFDVFQEFPVPKTLFIDTDQICRHIKIYHLSISRLFYWSVTERYMSSMEVQNDDSD
jgi:uncharacterized protein (TIGR04255 family)